MEAKAEECQGGSKYNKWYQNMLFKSLENILKHFKANPKANGFRKTNIKHTSNGGAQGKKEIQD
jgi:hypothetical protein